MPFMPNSPVPPASAPRQAPERPEAPEPNLDAYEAAMADHYATRDDEDDLADRYAAYADQDQGDDAPPVAFDESSYAEPPADAPRAAAPPASRPAPASGSRAPSAEGPDRFEAFKQRIAPLNDIELGTVLRALGATVNPDQRSHWVLPDGHVFQRFPHQQTAKDMADNKPFLNAVQIVARAKNIKPGQAAAWLEAEFTQDGVVRADVPRALPAGAARPHSAPRASQASTGQADAPSAARPNTPPTSRPSFKERIAPLETIALSAVFDALDASVTEGEDNARTWTLPNGKVFQGWAASQAYRVPEGKGGRGPMALVTQALDLRPGEAAQWLETRFMEQGQLKADTPLATASAGQGSRRAPMTDEERRAAFEARCEPLNQIDIITVLEALGGVQSKDDKFKYKMSHGEQANGHNIWNRRNTQIWKDLTAEKGGEGGVWLVQYHLGIRPGEAARWLEERFTQGGQLKDGVALASPSRREDTEAEYVEPVRKKEYEEDVRRYLVVERQIPRSLVDEELRQGRLYATYRGDRNLLAKNFPNLSPEELEGIDARQVPQIAHCVFSSEFGAEIRSVDPKGFKGTAKGTNPNKAGYQVWPIKEPVKEPVLSLVEAAVSGLSYRTFFPGRFTFSTNGVSRFKLQLQLVTDALYDWEKFRQPNGQEVCFGARIAFDADIPGDRGAQRLFNALFVMYYFGNQMRNARLGPLAQAQGLSVPAYLRTLSPEARKEEEEAFVDELFLVKEAFDKDALETMPGSSPHELFWGMDLGPRPDLPVHVRPDTIIKDNEPWLETGQTSGPVIELVINKPVLGLEKGRLTIPVTAAAHDYIVHQLNVRRDRPPMENDWNDELKAIGPSFARAYDACAAQGFLAADGKSPLVPELPPHLVFLREPAPRYHRPAPVTPAPIPNPPASRGARFQR